MEYCDYCAKNLRLGVFPVRFSYRVMSGCSFSLRVNHFLLEPAGKSGATAEMQRHVNISRSSLRLCLYVYKFCTCCIELCMLLTWRIFYTIRRRHRQQLRCKSEMDFDRGCSDTEVDAKSSTLSLRTPSAVCHRSLRRLCVVVSFLYWNTRKIAGLPDG